MHELTLAYSSATILTLRVSLVLLARTLHLSPISNFTLIELDLRVQVKVIAKKLSGRPRPGHPTVIRQSSQHRRVVRSLLSLKRRRSWRSGNKARNINHALSSPTLSFSTGGRRICRRAICTTAAVMRPWLRDIIIVTIDILSSKKLPHDLW